MPKKGFRTVTINDLAYGMAERRAIEEDTSVSDIVQKAIEQYVIKSREELEKINLLIKTAREAGILSRGT